MGCEHPLKEIRDGIFNLPSADFEASLCCPDLAKCGYCRIVLRRVSIQSCGLSGERSRVEYEVFSFLWDA